MAIWCQTQTETWQETSVGRVLIDTTSTACCFVWSDGQGSGGKEMKEEDPPAGEGRRVSLSGLLSCRVLGGGALVGFIRSEHHELKRLLCDHLKARDVTIEQ